MWVRYTDDLHCYYSSAAVALISVEFPTIMGEIKHSTRNKEARSWGERGEEWEEEGRGDTIECDGVY